MATATPRIFAPVFDELIRLSGGCPDYLYRPDEYAKPFFPVAESLEARAEREQQAGDLTGTRDLYLRAAAVYRIARARIKCSPLSNEA